MKRKYLVLLTLPLLFGLGGCHLSNEKAPLVFGSIVEPGLKGIKYSTLASMIDNERNFVLIVTPTGNCSCWNTFRTFITSYTISNNLVFYTIHNQDLLHASDEHKSTFGIDYRDDRETFLIFKDGKIFIQRVYDSKDSIFKQQKSFVEFFENSVIMPSMYYIGLDKFDELYNSHVAFSVYFSRNNCDDCGYIDRYFLKRWAIENNEFKNLYIIDCESIGIREYDEDQHLTPESQEKWDEFKENYGLAQKYNPNYGFNAGYVPTFLTYRGNDVSIASSVLSGAVYLNDSIIHQDDKFIVKDSYYTSERLEYLPWLSGLENTILKGMELNPNDVDKPFEEYEYYMWKREKAAEYHDPLLKAYLDYLVDFYKN